MELLFEFIFEVLLEGSFELVMNKKISLLIRVLVGIPLMVIYGGLFLLFTYFIFDSLKNHDYLVACIFLVIDILYIGLIYTLIRKKVKEVSYETKR